MLKKIMTVVGVVALLSAAVVFGQKWHNNRSNHHSRIEFSNPKKNILTSPSAPEFKVVLKSNPSTGFSWLLMDYNSNLIEKVDNQYYSFAVTKQPMVGASGYEEWVFKAKPEFFASNIVSTSLVFVYKRSWEKDVVQQLTFKVVTENAD